MQKLALAFVRWIQKLSGPALSLSLSHSPSVSVWVCFCVFLRCHPSAAHPVISGLNGSGHTAPLFVSYQQNFKLVVKWLTTVPTRSTDETTFLSFIVTGHCHVCQYVWQSVCVSLFVCVSVSFVWRRRMQLRLWKTLEKTAKYAQHSINASKCQLNGEPQAQ